MEKAQKEAQEVLDKARIDASNIQKNADDLAKKNLANKLAEAESKAQGIVDAANRELEKERGAMMSSLKDKVLDLSLSINTKVFDSKDSNVEFIKKEVNSIKI
jgi:F-type H+-transporting ATPase subunit b